MTETEARFVLADGDSNLGYRIVTEVARLERTDPLDLEAPLYEAVDVDAMATLLYSADGDASVTFRYCGHHVTVDGDGAVTVSESDGDGNDPGE